MIGKRSQVQGSTFWVRDKDKAVGFPAQNIYKMTYGDENATFEPLNL
jgi:hypothetical protein